MPLTKQDIDALVDRMGYLPWFSHGQHVTERDMKIALYLAAGLTADGKWKPERVRCWRVVNPEYPTFNHFWGHDPKGEFFRHYHKTPGWFVPEGAE